MRTTAIITAGMLLSASLLGGCGGDDKDKDAKGSSASSGKGYCALLKSSRDELKSMSGNDVPDVNQFQKFIDRADELSDKAPSEVSDDWKVLTGALDDLQKALDEAGITLAQLAEIAAGKMPEGVTQADLTELGTKMQELSSEDFEKATTAITKHAKDECDVDLDDDLTGSSN